jgi:hypothetical protein
METQVSEAGSLIPQDFSSAAMIHQGTPAFSSMVRFAELKRAEQAALQLGLAQTPQRPARVPISRNTDLLNTVIQVWDALRFPFIVSVGLSIGTILTPNFAPQGQATIGQGAITGQTAMPSASIGATSGAGISGSGTSFGSQVRMPEIKPMALPDTMKLPDSMALPKPMALTGLNNITIPLKQANTGMPTAPANESPVPVNHQPSPYNVPVAPMQLPAPGPQPGPLSAISNGINTLFGVPTAFAAEAPQLTQNNLAQIRSSISSQN